MGGRLDVRKFTSVSYRTLVLQGCCPKRKAHLGSLRPDLRSNIPDLRSQRLHLRREEGLRPEGDLEKRFEQLVLGLRDPLRPLPKEKRIDERNRKKTMHLINFSMKRERLVSQLKEKSLSLEHLEKESNIIIAKTESLKRKIHGSGECSTTASTTSKVCCGR